MGLFDIFNRRKEVKSNIEERKVHLGGLLFNNLNSYSENRAMNLSAFYSGVEQISNSIAMLPKNIVSYDNDERHKIEHSLWYVLNVKPNNKWVPFTMWKEAIEHVIIKGAAYFYIERDSNLNVKAIYPIENDFVQPMILEDGTVKYSVVGMGIIDAVNMLDFAMHRDNLYKGVSLLKYAREVLRSSANAEKASDNFYKSGAGLSGILKASATLTNEQKLQIRESWEQAFNSDKARGIAVLPQGLDFSPVSVAAKDAQLLESRDFNIDEVARYLNISPIKLYKLKDVSYSSLEATNLCYLEDTIKPYAVMISHEINLKLFKPSEIGKVGVDFDFTDAMQTNKQALAEYYRTLLTNGVLSINDIRKQLGFPVLKGAEGDCHWLQISYASAADIAEGKFIKQDNQSQNQKVDNKVKE